jgi:hypothetical protein
MSGATCSYYTRTIIVGQQRWLGDSFNHAEAAPLRGGSGAASA